MSSASRPLTSAADNNEGVSTYVGDKVVGLGMTGLVVRSKEGCAIKVPRIFTVESFSKPDSEYVEYLNGINREALKREKDIYERLGRHKGIITCFRTSDEKIELAFAEQGNLDTYIKSHAEPEESLKVKWILSVVETLSYIHSRKVLVDEIALRNILVTGGQLKFSDFGQSYLLPMTVDMDQICENELNAKIEILHLGWVIYSIAVWDVFNYYHFAAEHSQSMDLQDLPPTDKLFCGSIVRKCWNGDYSSAKSLDEDARHILCGTNHAHVGTPELRCAEVFPMLGLRRT